MIIPYHLLAYQLVIPLFTTAPPFICGRAQIGWLLVISLYII